ncbi:hypothetical protein GCM10009637_07960 [Brevibacterium luteolum]
MGRASRGADPDAARPGASGDRQEPACPETAGEERTGCPPAADAGEGAYPRAGPDVQVPDAQVPDSPVAADLIAAALTREVQAVVVLVGRMPAACRPAAAQAPGGGMLVPGSAAVGL